MFAGLPSQCLEEWGWIQEDTGVLDGEPRCMMGSIDACLEGDAHSRAWKWMKERFCGYHPFGDLNFNDAPGRTKEEVIAVLKEMEKALGLEVEHA